VGKILDDLASSYDWIAKALQSSGYAADFSPGSLREIERFFEEQTLNGAARQGGLLSESLGSRLFALGGYVGEVIRRERGGAWIANDDDPQAEINITLKLPDGSTIWPMQRVMKRFRNGSEDSLTAYGTALGLVLGPRPGVKKAGWLGRILGAKPS